MSSLFVVPELIPHQILLARNDFEILFLSSYALGLLLCWYVPAKFKQRHVADQGRILDRCRALLIVGMRALETGNERAAEEELRKIRRLERRWRLGNCLLFRTSLAVWAIGAGIAACVAVRFLTYCSLQLSTPGVALSAHDVTLEMLRAMALSVTAPLWALASYFGSWRNRWAIDDCGDRLANALYGSRRVDTRVETTDSSIPNFGGMSPHRTLGVGPHFTLRELNRARRKLVQNLHPDRWQMAPPDEIRLREDALKAVNAAYDFLRPQAG